MRNIVAQVKFEAMVSTTIQASLWESHPISNDEIALHLKTYLQPFERELALRELGGLGFEILRSEEPDSVVAVRPRKGKVSVEDRLRRLAYFDWYSSDSSTGIPTLQALRECSGQSVGAATSLPKRRVLRFGPHDLHEYRGKYFPQLVRSLSNIAGLNRKSVVLDPMCGSGTTLVECRSLDIKSIGIDRNPLSALIATAKALTVGWSAERVDEVRACYESVRKTNSGLNPWNESDSEYLSRWFAPEALNDLRHLVGRVEAIKDREAKLVFKAILSDIIRSVSYQHEDDLRVRKHIKPYTPGCAIESFDNKMQSAFEQIRSLCAIDGSHLADFEVKSGDARNSAEIVKCSVDCVITSPPYATALPYIDTDRLSLVVLGLAKRQEHRDIEAEMIGTREISEKERLARWTHYLESKPSLPHNVVSLIDSLAEQYHGDSVGFRRRNLPSLLGAYFLDIRAVLLSLKKILKQNGTVFFVVGNNSTNTATGKVEIHTDHYTMEIAESVGFTVERPIDMELLVSRDIFRTNRGSREQILIFKAK